MSKRKSTQSALKLSASAPSYKLGYTYEQLQNLTEKELKRLYSKTRSVLRKRVERMTEKGVQYVPGYNWVKNELLLPVSKAAEKINNPKQWAQRVYSMGQVLGREEYTVKGATKYYKAMLENQGFIAPGESLDVEGLNRFFQLARSMVQEADFDSDRVIQEWRELHNGMTEGKSELQKRWLEFNSPYKKPTGNTTPGKKLKSVVKRE